MKRLHIIGSGPRSGTTLVAEVMHTCFNIDQHCEHEAPICTDEPDHGHIYLTKQPGDLTAVKWPLKLNPDLYVICVIRDPRDSIVSSHGSKPGVYWTSLRYWKKFLEVFPDLKGRSRFIYFYYEDLVTKPDEIQKFLQKNIPFLKNEHNFSDFHLVAKPSEGSLQALKSVRPIAPVGLGAWKEHLPRIKQQLMIHGDISDSLIEHGYEKDNRWNWCLENVQPGTLPTHLPEKWRLLDTYKRKQNEAIEIFNILCRNSGTNPKLIKKPFRIYRDYSRLTVKFIVKKLKLGKLKRMSAGIFRL